MAAPKATPKPRYHGRRQPYTARGIARVPCSRCGKPSRYQWQACANGRRFVGVCAACDLGLNMVALHFMRIPNADALLAAYAAKIAQAAE